MDKRTWKHGCKNNEGNIVVDSNGYFIKPVKLDITKEKILAYVNQHPIPEDPEYSLDDLIADLAEQHSICPLYSA